MSARKVLFCTGANQGLGYSIVKLTALREPSWAFVLACRDISKGRDAVEKLRGEGITAELGVVELDVENDEHIEKAVKSVGDKYGKLDVLVNNAGFVIFRPPDDSLASLRRVYDNMTSVHLTSVAVITTAFLPLLHKAPSPRVINITSGLGSITNTLTKKMGRVPHYGASKIGMNGATMHMQTAEIDRIAAQQVEGRTVKDGRIRFYVVQPGVLKTAFANYPAVGKDPDDGAEAAVRLAVDDGDTYPGGTYWEFERGEMRTVPW